MRKAISAKKAKFRMSTIDFLWLYLRCKFCARNKDLRNSVSNRKILNYRKGEEKLNKELDIGVILNKLR